MQERMIGVKIAKRNINNLRYTDDTTLTSQNGRTKEPPDEGERGEWKSWLKSLLQKTKIMASSPIIPWQIDGEKVETAAEFTFLTSKSLQMVTAATKLKDTCPLEEKLWQT